MGSGPSKKKRKESLCAGGQIVLDPLAEPVPGESAVVSSVPLSSDIRLKKGELIGKGTFGNVYKCLDESNGRLIVMKEILMSGETEEENRRQIALMKQEIFILKQVKHPNVVEYLGTNLVGELEGAGIIEEYVSGGSLRQLLKQFGRLEEQIVRVYVRQILTGLAYLHSLNILHRDLKCANILLDAQGLVKIADLGSSIKMDSPNYVHNKTLVGSLFWLPPESALNLAYSTKSDIWSLGCLSLEMLQGSPPFSTLSQKQVLSALARGERPPLPSHLSDSCSSFLTACLQFQPSLRPSASQLLGHPFLNPSHQEASSVSGAQVNSLHKNWHSVYPL